MLSRANDSFPNSVLSACDIVITFRGSLIKSGLMTPFRSGNNEKSEVQMVKILDSCDISKFEISIKKRKNNRKREERNLLVHDS